MLQSSRIPLVSGIGLAAMGLIVGCFAARVSTFTCIRGKAEQQGICRLEKSTVFLPWNKTVENVQLNNIQKAEFVETGDGSYTVVLRLHSDVSSFLIHNSEYSNNARQIARQINSFLGNPSAKTITVQEGGSIEETAILIGFCGFSLLFASIGTKFWHNIFLKKNLS